MAMVRTAIRLYAERQAGERCRPVTAGIANREYRNSSVGTAEVVRRGSENESTNERENRSIQGWRTRKRKRRGGKNERMHRNARDDRQTDRPTHARTHARTHVLTPGRGVPLPSYGVPRARNCRARGALQFLVVSSDLPPTLLVVSTAPAAAAATTATTATTRRRRFSTVAAAAAAATMTTTVRGGLFSLMPLFI
ncbi:PREDICTED: uncharacterized protein LOC108688827 [Atta colombica]|uniref:uncharacterized protein LOC108688827 n=1 Tax=Atta colombica TaxID=520822 RepID=UPI00084C88EB|nr:PREDICTED: uncharacterized protein LOC108688827 [Atta colombica]